MKKMIAVLGAAALLCAVVSVVPEAAVSAVPSVSVISAKNVMYSESLTSCGSLSYVGQSDVTSALPLVIKNFTVAEGDTVNAGDVIALVDREGSASFIDSMGQLPQLAVAAADLSAAISLIPSEITADRTGRVISTAGAGAAVESGSSIATIAGTDTLIVTAPVSEEYISRVGVGSSVTFTLAACPDEVFTGKVTAIAAAARMRYSGSVLETVVDVTVAPDRYDVRFKSGLSADVRFSMTEPRKICVLPYEAIGQDDGGEYVYVYTDGKACKKKIFTGAEFSDGTEVIKGVTAEDMVFTSPEKISESAYVRWERQE